MWQKGSDNVFTSRATNEVLGVAAGPELAALTSLLTPLLTCGSSGRWGPVDRLLALRGSGPAGPSGRYSQLPSWNSLVQNAAVTVQRVDQGAVFFSESPIVLLCRSQGKDRTACIYQTVGFCLSECDPLFKQGAEMKSDFWVISPPNL